jgi:carboxyl-terminal processing protease
LAYKRSRWRWPSIVVAVLWTACLLPRPAAGLGLAPEEIRRQAEQAERSADWARACELYEQLPSKERNLPEIKKRYQACVRYAQQVRRHQDPTYQDQVRLLTLFQALEVYEEVLNKLQDFYVERPKVDLTLLFRQGLEELRRALGDPAFRRAHLPAAKPAVVADFQARLQQLLRRAADGGDLKVRRAKEAQNQAQALAQAAHETLGLKPAVVVLELVCGACNALDEYSVYLTPGQYSDIHAALKGEIVGIGIDLVAGDQQLVITQVFPGGSAEMVGLKPGDYITRIAGQPTHDMPADAALAQLRGDAGSTVELEVVQRGDVEPRVYRLPRRPVRLPSVSEPRFVGEQEAGIAYLQVVGFHATTVQELDQALLELQTRGMKALILDLRGNPGGLFPVAVEVVKRFVAEGVIVTTQGYYRDFNKIYASHSMQAVLVPLVVLVDGDTASVAEIVAGALKEHQRGYLIGQPTFGKGMMQKVRRLTTTAAGIQISVARFYSPRGQTFDAVGVVPDLLVERTPPETAMDMAEDLQLESALRVARELVMGR